MHCGGVWSRRNCANNFVINLNGFNVDVISKLINIKWGPFYVWREWDFKHDPVGNWIYRIEDPSCSRSQTSSDQAAVLRWQFKCTPYIKLIFATNHFNIHNNNDTLNCIILNNRFRLTYKRQNWRNNSANLSPLSGSNTSHTKQKKKREFWKEPFESAPILLRGPCVPERMSSGGDWMAIHCDDIITLATTNHRSYHRRQCNLAD